MRRTVTCVLSKLPAVLPTNRPKQCPHVVPHPPPKISPPEPVANPQQHLVQLSRPHIRAHIFLHDQNNSDRAPPVTNSRHMTDRQLATLGNRLLTSGDSELQLEYQPCQGDCDHAGERPMLREAKSAAAGRW
ncbi:hypothetical protein GCM10017771_38080 [Streptomyces capitiformicae]|uniref:Uncharacterized protein n=1 Tax=Streptomyces capitiformicae TaxID=2014920 RepID=A0A919GRA1_9ACTN|nr:hypothetical protein GCM10017771_38080 [Streptomyces capitiformicae]